MVLASMGRVIDADGLVHVQITEFTVEDNGRIPPVKNYAGCDSQTPAEPTQGNITCLACLAMYGTAPIDTTHVF